MREIKFRGYSKAINKFIYGCLVKSWSKKYEDFIDDKLMIISQNNNIYYEVDKDSIGQYTSSKDKNGVEIYEGDIVKYGSQKYNVVFKVGKWLIENKTLEPLFDNLNFVEIIGNIYEEKLKESK